MPNGYTLNELRGESRGIIILRGFILGGIVLGVPIFAFFSILVNPLGEQVFVREMPRGWYLKAPIMPRNAIIKFHPIFHHSTVRTAYNITTNVTAATRDATVHCQAKDPELTSPSGPIVECPLSWVNITNITISIDFPPQDPAELVHVIPGQGDIRYLLQLTDPIPVLPGFDLWASVTWTSREVFPIFEDRSRFARRQNVLIMEVATLLPTKQLADTSGTVSPKLTLVPRGGRPTKYLQEYMSGSIIDGMSAVGGFWTFLNGTFILLFGANIMYFTFRRRPLSALGIVHYFQRRDLLRQWREDFPALYTEGGQPGSVNAGIVAFIRERLVDLGEEEGPATRPGVEAQDGPATQTESHPGIPERTPDTFTAREPMDPELDGSSIHTGDTGITEWATGESTENHRDDRDDIALLDVNVGEGSTQHGRHM
ncbi:hypothetical protein C8J57DRAFT_1503159 [Mycena rebaudengoi]|nr:hypothetical protein C8J57DRAFT_1503159 [Mycena rebaudengoi]